VRIVFSISSVKLRVSGRKELVAHVERKLLVQGNPQPSPQLIGKNRIIGTAH